MTARLRSAGDALLGAFRFLTVVPLPGPRSGPDDGPDPVPDPGAVTRFFPLVGLAIGLGLAGLRGLLPADGLLPAALVLVAWTAATGALHEDGWADVADAALPPVDRARRLRILRDPRVGAHGLVAVVALMLVRLAAVADAPWWALTAPPVVGRWAMVASLALAKPLRPGGLGASLAASARPGGASVVALGSLAVAVVVSVAAAVPGEAGPGGAGPGAVLLPALLATTVATAVGGACGLGVGAFLHGRFGGLSGDGHGAVGLAAETGALCALALQVGAGAGGTP